MSEHNIVLPNVVAFDEYNDFPCKAAKRVQTSEAEADMCTGPWVSRVQGGRVTLTGCVVYSPVRKGKMLLFIQKCSQKMQKDIEDDFGGWIKLVVGEGKSVNGSRCMALCL